MAKSASLFPHFIRIFSAAVLWSMLLFVLSLNAYAKLTLVPEVFPSMIAAMSMPQTAAAHVVLAQKFWSLGFLTAGTRELAIAETFPTNVLGASTLKRAWEQEPKLLSENYYYWQSIVGEKPDYQAGLIYTAGLAYELGKTDEGKLYLGAAMRLDPNSYEGKNLLLLLR